MFNSAQKHHKKKLIITLILIGIVSVLVFVYKDSKPIAFLQGAFQSFFEKPRSFVYAIGRGEEKNEVEKLNKRIKELEQKLVEFETVKKDNEALRNQFNENGETTQSLATAKIIGFLGENQKPHELVINAGKSKGIEKGMTVIFNKYLIGKVETVTQNFSNVITPFNPKFQVLAKLTDTNANGIVVGRSDLLLFDGVLITDQLKEGGIVTTKGEVDKEGIGVVPDIIIGKISSISKRETAPFQSAQLVPLVDFSKLTTVFVITKM